MTHTIAIFFALKDSEWKDKPIADSVQAREQVPPSQVVASVEALISLMDIYIGE